MTSRGETKVLTVGQIRHWRPGMVGREMRGGRPANNPLAPLVFPMEALLRCADSAEPFCRLGQVPVRRTGWNRIDTSQRAILTVLRARNGIWAPVPHCNPTGHPSMRTCTVTEE
jgi:hypothetical protein